MYLGRKYNTNTIIYLGSLKICAFNKCVCVVTLTESGDYFTDSLKFIFVNNTYMIGTE